MNNNTFEKNIIQVWGDQGRSWLKNLPSIIDALTIHWNLSNLIVVDNLSYNYVMTAYQDKLPVILKICCNLNDFQKEAATLISYDGNCAIRLLDSYIPHHALLLEKAIPGTSLIPLFPDQDDHALAITAHIMKSLHAAPIPRQANIPTLTEWFRELYKPHPALDTYHIEKAQNLVQQLLATQPEFVLLHGDLHHGNILLSDRGWLAIDPKGIAGDPAFEVCAFVRNPHPHILKPKKIIMHRLELFADILSIDQQRLHAWVYVQMVLDACWAMQDGQTDQKIALAQACEVDFNTTL